MRFALLAIVLGFLAPGFLFSPAFAATSTASFGVSAIVQSSCQASTPVLAFGNTLTAGRTPVSVTCTLATPYNVSFSPGLTASAALRATAPGKSLTGFALPPSSVRSFGRGRVVGANSTAGTRNGSAMASELYSQNAWSQEVASSAFADAITVTVTY